MNVFVSSSRAAMLAAFALAALTSARCAAAAPNVLVILADDLGYGDLSCYGATDLRTPNIDALVSSGMRFTNFYASCTVCSPTRAALLSGRYPDLVGVPGVIRTHPATSWGKLASDATLLPAVLKRAAYHTAIVGKWHLGLDRPDTPNDRGFDLFRGFLGDMMDDYFTHLRHGQNYLRHNQTEIKVEGHATDLFTDWAVEYLESRRGQDAPFFLYLAYNAPHTPVQPPDDWLAKVKARDPRMDEKRAKLVALIEHMDHGVGRVLDALARSGKTDETLVIFTSDNGGQLDVGGRCGPYRGGKQDMYEGGIRVPMIAKWPGHIAAGSQSDTVALSMDLFPTICEAAGVTAEHTIDGASILPVLRGQPPEQDERLLVWMRREGNTKYLGQDYYTARRGDWKLLQNSPFEPYELYNLADDPREEHDLAASQPRIVRDLAGEIQRHLQQAGAVPWQGQAIAE